MRTCPSRSQEVLENCSNKKDNDTRTDRWASGTGTALGEFNRHCQCPAMSRWHSPSQGTSNLLIPVACPCESACLAYAQGTPQMPGSKCPTEISPQLVTQGSW